MEHVIERIIKITESNGVSGVELGKLLGLKKSPLTDWKNGQSRPTLIHLIIICEKFGVSADYILFGREYSRDLTDWEVYLISSYRKLSDVEKGILLGRLETLLEDSKNKPGTEINDEIQNYNITTLYKVELWGDISAGGGIDAIANREVINAPVKCDFALRVKGDSMEPTFKNNSIIFLIQECELRYNGEIAAVQVDDFTAIAFLKKVYKKEETIRLVSINPTYDDIVLPTEKVTILGKVVYPQV